MGCNGDCYQGRWCSCKDTVTDADERYYAYVVAVFVTLVITVVGVIVL